MQKQELFRLMIHRIWVSKSTKKPVVTLELFYPDPDNPGAWKGGGEATFAEGDSMSLFSEAIAYPVPWTQDAEQSN